MARDGNESYIYRRGSSPATRVAISGRNRLLSKPFTQASPTQKFIGAVGSFDRSESRSVDPIRGIGFGDKIAENIPGMTEPMQITLNKTLLYTANIVQELGYKGGVDGLVRSLRHHKWPFDIRSELVFSELVTAQDQAAILIKKLSSEATDPNFALITLYEACWLNSLSDSSSSDNAAIMEDASITVTDVSDGSSLYGASPDSYGELLNSGNSPILQPGAGSRLFG
jgi:hypothetical protein